MNEKDFPLSRITKGVYQSRIIGDNEITHNGETLYRFMDFFYINNPPHLLEQNQVIFLCRARANNPEIITESKANSYVKECLREVVKSFNPNSLLEIGCGKFPIVESNIAGNNIFLADSDPELAEYFSSSAYTFSCFSIKSPLPLKNNSIQLIIAAFVFHFHIDNFQIGELQRCLVENGVIIANVYSRDNLSKNDLEKQFNSYGFLVERLKDPINVCKKNEFWIIYKNLAEISIQLVSLENILNSVSANYS